MKGTNGLMVGLVTNLKDPDGHGKVEISFPRLPGKNRAWASVAVPMAGKNRGFYFQPEVNDEVLVAFEDGAAEHPYIVGFVWNGVDVPPESDPQKRVIVTPGGHQLRFDDDPSSKSVQLRTSSGIEICLDDTKQELSLSCAGFKIGISPSGIVVSAGG
jgi:uncharacterized protein involved in type VI secretion and phage assembly